MNYFVFFGNLFLEKKSFLLAQLQVNLFLTNKYILHLILILIKLVNSVTF